MFHISGWGIGDLFGGTKASKATLWWRDWLRAFRFCVLSLGLMCNISSQSNARYMSLMTNPHK